MQYLPTIQLTPQVSMLLSKGALHLQPGQWVAGEKGIGRYLRTDHRTGTTYVSWVRPGDDWTTQSQRFHRACMKGYVGKYASRYEGLKPARLGGDRRLRAPSPLPSSQAEEDPGHSAATL
jgi:hypothetical protein